MEGPIPGEGPQTAGVIRHHQLWCWGPWHKSSPACVCKPGSRGLTWSSRKCTVTFCRPNIAAHTCAFAGVAFCNQEAHICWKSLLTSLQYILTVLISVLLTHVCLFVSLSASAAVSVVAADLPSLTHCPTDFLLKLNRAQPWSQTPLLPDFPLYPCVLPAWRVLFIFFQVLQASGKSQLLQEVLFDCSRPRCLLPIPAGLRRPPSIRTDLFSCALYAPTRPASCLTRRLGVAGSIPWGSFQLTVMHVALLSIRLSSNDTQRRPGHCHPLSTLQGLPSEAACKRQFPSPVVAKGRSRLQLVHTVDHQFRRPGTEAHV